MTRRSRHIWIALAVALLLAARGVHADTGLAEALLRWRAEWPEVAVKVPVSLYWVFAQSMLNPKPAEGTTAPVDWFISRADYSARLEGETVRLQLRLEVHVLNPTRVTTIPMLPARFPWQEVAVGGKPVALRESDGWLHLDSLARPDAAGPVTVALSAKVDLRGSQSGGVNRLVLPTVQSAMTTLSVDSGEAWEVRSSRAPLPLVGSQSAGTHGMLGVAGPSGKGDTGLEVTWQKPQPPVSRAGYPTYDAYLAWHLDEGVQDVRATLDVRIVGGELDTLRLRLPPGTDRLSVSGPDVLETRTAGQSATVNLKGKIKGATQLSVQFAIPWSGKGRTALSGFGIEGGRLQGGAMVITSGAGGVVLEDEMPGLQEKGLWEAPERAASLAAAAPLMCYAFMRDDWRASVDVASLAEAPVQETIVDSADYTVLLRPDGALMHKVEMRVRNRNRQFLRLRLPRQDDQIIVARVSDKSVAVSQGQDGELLMPLDKSVETLSGGVSFPVEVVFLSHTPALRERGRLVLPLLRTDLPAARAQCSVYVPDGLRTTSWEGAFKLAEKFSVEVGRMEYGRGHAPAASAAAATAKGAAAKPEADQEQSKRLLGENYLRVATETYKKGDIEGAEKAARKAVELGGGGKASGEASGLLENIEVLKGKRAPQSRSERVMAEQIKGGQSAMLEDVQSRQQQLLRQGWEKAREGQETAAADFFRAAEEVGRPLGATDEGKKLEQATLSEARKWLSDYDRQVAVNEELRKKTKEELQKRQPEFHKEVGFSFTDVIGGGRNVRQSGAGLTRPADAASPAQPRMNARPGELAKRTQATPPPVSGPTGATTVAPSIVATTPAPQGGAGVPERPFRPVRSTIADDIEMDVKELAPNVEAKGQIAMQRASGKNTMSQPEAQSISGENIRLQKELDSFVNEEWLPNAPAQPRPLANDGEAAKRLEDYKSQLKVKEELERKKAAALTEQAKAELYVQNHPDVAKQLALVAVDLDSSNKEARDVLTEARAQLGEKSAMAQQREGAMDRSAFVQLDKLKNELSSTMSGAQKLYAQGKYEESLAEWRRAKAYVGLLSVYQNAQEEAKTIDDQLKDVGEIAKKAAQERYLSAVAEAKKQMAAGVQIGHAEASKQAELLDRMWGLARDKRYDEAEKLAGDRLFKDPNDKGARVLLEQIRQVRQGSQEGVPSEIVAKFSKEVGFDFGPSESRDKQIWKDVISPRESVTYPPGAKQYTPEELEIVKRLDKKVSLAFDETPMTNVVEFLQETTGVNFSLDRRDLGADLNPITLHIETSLKRALDEISDLTGLAWKVDGPIVKIAKAERFKAYETRVYDISDLVSNKAEGQEMANFLNRNADTADIFEFGSKTQPFSISQPEAGNAVQYVDGHIAISNNGFWGSDGTKRAEDILSNLRRNLGQKVAYNSRGLALTDKTVESMGVGWNSMPNGRWATVDEAQFNSLLSLEQKQGSAGGGIAKGQNEIVPGTEVSLPNGARLGLRMARDESNSFDLNGDGVAIELPHEQVLLVENNGAIVAVRAGATQFWSETPQAPEIQEAPAEITVPAVGVPVRFEKVLVQPEDDLVIECDYVFEEV